MGKRYQKFCETRQEPLKLKIALQEYFSEETLEETERKAYGAYLKKRIRPAGELLLEQGETKKLFLLEEAGFFGKKELDGFLKTARERGWYRDWILLLKRKAERYGFQEEEFSLWE